MTEEPDQLSPQIVSIVIAIIGLVIVGLFIYSAIYRISYSEEKKNAENLTEILKAKINAVNDNNFTETIIQGFLTKGAVWVITGWSETDRTRPDKCSFSSCICVCKKTEKTLTESCQYNGFCSSIEKKTLKIYDFSAEPEQEYETTIEGKAWVYTGNYKEVVRNYIQVPKNMFKIRIEKTKEEIKIMHFTEDYSNKIKK